MADHRKSRAGHDANPHRALLPVAALACTLALLVSGCGGESNPLEPTGLALVLSNPRVQITRSVEATAVSTYPNARDEDPDCAWYVDGILGGNAMKGTITQTNPATFTAPPAVPAGGVVEITAASRSDSTFTASDTLRIAFTIRYVDGGNGNDTSSGGTWTNPLRTLTYALDLVAHGDTLSVLPASYCQDHGEAGPYFVPGGVALLGTCRESCRLYGTGSDYNVVRLGDGATISGFTIGNWDADDIAILTTGGGLIKDVAVNEPFRYSAIRADGGRQGRGNDVVIESCELINTTAPGTGRALELYYGTHCVVRDCTISGWAEGVYVNRDSDPLIERNTITDNGYGVIAAGGGGFLTEPDLGGGARGSAGGNTIRDNAYIGVYNWTDATIWALNNTWTTDPPTEGPIPTDFFNLAGGAIIWAR